MDSLSEDVIGYLLTFLPIKIVDGKLSLYRPHNVCSTPTNSWSPSVCKSLTSQNNLTHTQRQDTINMYPG